MTDLPRNIYEQQAHNRRLTVSVMAVFVLFVGFLGVGLDLYLFGSFPGPDGEGGIPFPVGTVAAVGIASIWAFWSLRSGAATVISSAGAQPIDEQDPGYRVLKNVVDEMSIAAGIPPPRLYVVPDDDPNAFATGSDPSNASIAVTRGLIERLSRDELQGVIAHEMSHIRNEDIRLMTVVAALIGSVTLIAELGLRTMRFGGGRGGKRDSRGGGGAGGAVFLALWLVALVLAPVISRLLAMAVSRQREYLADASGAELTRNPAALASALERISAADEPTRSIKKGTAHLCIADPLGREGNEREGFFADLFGTHPPLRKRVTLLRAMAYGPG
jgi:heat shock protein HtpX